MKYPLINESGKIESWLHSDYPLSGDALPENARTTDGLTNVQIEFYEFLTWTEGGWEYPDDAPTELAQEGAFVELIREDGKVVSWKLTEEDAPIPEMTIEERQTEFAQLIMIKPRTDEIAKRMAELVIY